MTENTCPAKKEICQPLTIGWYCKKHGYTGKHHNDTDGSPCGEGCKAQEKPGPEKGCGCKCHDPGWKCFNCNCLKDDLIAAALWKIAHIVKTDLYPEAITDGVRSLQKENERLDNGWHKANEQNLGKSLARKKAEAEQDELQEYIRVLVEACIRPYTESRGETQWLECSLCKVRHPESLEEAFRHKPTCPIPTLPVAARKRGEYVAGLEKALGEINQSANPPAPRHPDWAIHALGTIIYIVREALNPKEETL